MPLVAARLPVLQALHVQRGPQPLRGVQGVLVEQSGHLGQRGVLELLQPGGEQVVHPVGGLLGVAAEEPLEDQHAVGQLPLVVDLALVGEQVVAQVHGVGEGVAQHLHRAGRGDDGGHLGVAGVLDQVRRPRRPADLAAHLDVVDGVGDPAGVDVGQLPQRLVEQVAGALREAGPPVGGAGRHGAGPQVGQAGLHGVGGGRGDRAVSWPVFRHERAQRVQVGPASLEVAGALEQLEEVVVEVEHPHVPVSDQVKQLGRGVGVGVSAQQRVVVGVEVSFAPDRRAALRDVDHVHRPGPGLAVRPGLGQVRVAPGRIRRVELGQLE